MSACSQYIDIEYFKRKNYCESCSAKLKIEDWPWLFNGLLSLCPECKIKAQKLLNK